MPFNEANELVYHDIKLSFPPYCFYDTILFDYRKAPVNNASLFADLHYVHNMYTPVHKDFRISLKLNRTVKKALLNKLCLVYINEEDEESVYYAGGKWEDGFLTARVRDLGIYSVGIDTLPPLVEPIRFRSGATLNDDSELRIRIHDEFSGIDSYRALIDGKWALFEYDPKNSLLIYTPDKERLEKGKKHKLQVRVSDNRDNESVLDLEFYY